MDNLDDSDDFLQGVVPDLNQEIDRVCLALLEMDLQKAAREARGSKAVFDRILDGLREALYNAPSTPPQGEWGPLYPAQHLCYWVEVRADYWREAGPPTDTWETKQALEALLVDARHLQTIIARSSAQVPSESDLTGIAQVRKAQEVTIEAVIKTHSTSPPKQGP